MQENDNISKLFDYNETEQLFRVNMDQLKEIEKSILLANKRIDNFIDERIHPKSKSLFYELLEDYKKCIADYSLKEREQVYKTGFSDAVKIIIDSISI